MVYGDVLHRTTRKAFPPASLVPETKVTQKSVWHMLHRIRAAIELDRTEPMTNTVEIDETYVGSKERNKHVLSPLRALKEAALRRARTVVLGVLSVMARCVWTRLIAPIQRASSRWCSLMSARQPQVNTDEGPQYNWIRNS